MRALIGAIALALAAPAFAENAAPWRPVDETTGQIRDIEGLEQLAADFPDSGTVRLRLLQPYLAAGESEKLIETLNWLKKRGYVFGETPRAQVPRLVGEDYADAARAAMLPQAASIEASAVIATVPADAGLIEGVFVPSEDSAVVVTSVTGRTVHIYEPQSGWTAMPVPGANDLSGIVGEPDQSMGWVASSNIDQSDEAEPGFVGLMGLRGDFQNPVLVPAAEGAALGDLTIGADATVYASDPLNGGVYRKPVGATELETLVAPGILRSPQGLAVSADGSHLYVSDYRYGLAIIDLASGAVSRLASDVPAIIDGVDGLWLHNGELIAVQNGTAPMRISAFKLSEDGRRIVGVRVLEQAHPEWTEPLGGTISDGALIYIGTGQWDRYIMGEPAANKPAIPTQIRRLPLGTAGD